MEKVIYLKNLFNENDPKTLKDKHRQNFNIICSNYKLINNKLYYNKSKNKEDSYKIPLESEKLNLLSITYFENGHIGYVRLYNEILEKNLYGRKCMKNVNHLLKIVLLA